MTKLMHQGYSWSGHERKCCYLNLGDSTFANISATSGLDFDDDGRAMAVCDWDQDGDLDVWLKNRTGPQLRFMRNDGPAEQRFLDIQLVGKSCNRDAIGAVVELHAGSKKFTRTITCGDGYLSGSSKWLHFGLTGAEPVNLVKIRWPGGETQSFADLPLNRRYRIEQDSPTAIEISAQLIPMPSAQKTPFKLPRSTKLVLRAPLPLPPTLSRGLINRPDKEAPADPSKRATLVTLWAQWCAPCLFELSDMADHLDPLHRANLDIVTLNIDRPEDRAIAETLFAEKIRPRFKSAPFREVWSSNEMKETLDAILVHIREQSGDWPLPMSLLIDPNGTLQIIYLGPISTKPEISMSESPAPIAKDQTPEISLESLTSDLKNFCLAPDRSASRAAYPGRWYFKTPRDFAALARDLKARGQKEDSRFYSSLAAPEPKPPPSAP
ncbi:MAG: ASPIC/UnbV domain-containing protein [Planctomycetota bacterium]